MAGCQLLRQRHSQGHVLKGVVGNHWTGTKLQAKTIQGENVRIVVREHVQHDVLQRLVGTIRIVNPLLHVQVMPLVV